jgi:hypothetical protein
MKDMDNVQLGRVKVLSHTGTSRNYSISSITKNILPEVITTVSSANPSLEFNNNFRALKSEQFVDPLESVMYEYGLLVNNRSESEIMRYSPDKFAQLASLIESDKAYEKTKLLKELLEAF